MPSIVDPSGRQADVIQSRKRTKVPAPCLLDPGCRRRRSLFIAFAVSQGFTIAELATWLRLSPRQVRRLANDVAAAGQIWREREERAKKIRED